MVRVRQHGEDGQLFDMPAFLPVVEQSLQPEEWLLDIESVSYTHLDVYKRQV